MTGPVDNQACANIDKPMITATSGTNHTMGMRLRRLVTGGAEGVGGVTGSGEDGGGEGGELSMFFTITD